MRSSLFSPDKRVHFLFKLAVLDHAGSVAAELKNLLRAVQNEVVLLLEVGTGVRVDSTGSPTKTSPEFFV